MNEKEFLVRIKGKQNLNGFMTASIIRNLLDTPEDIETDKENIFNRISKRFVKTKSARQIIQDNFEMVLDCTSDDQIGAVLKELLLHSDTKDIIKEEFETILNRFNVIKDSCDIEDGTTYVITRTRRNFLTEFREDFNGQEILRDNIDKIFDMGFGLLDVPALKGLSEDIDKRIEEKLQNSKRQIAQELIRESRMTEKDKNIALQNHTDVVAIMISELLASENARMIDIRQIGKGNYSKVYQIGEKVLKIGKPRVTYQIPSHIRILRPLVKINLLDEESRPIACIEVSNRVDVLEPQEMDKEKLYQLYKELRQDGIIWTDIRFANVGKLRKQIVEGAHDFDESTDKKEGRSLQVGDWVILDTDYIYDQNEHKIQRIFFRDARDGFEKRYQQEKQSQISEKYRKKADEPKTAEGYLKEEH